MSARTTAYGVRALAGAVLRQVLRDRTALMFMLVLPVAVIVIIGTTFGGQGRLDVGLVGGESTGTVASALVEGLERADGVDLHRYGDVESLQRAVRRFSVAGGIVVPADLDERLAAGGTVDVAFIAFGTDETALTARRVVAGLLERAGVTVAAARFTTEEAGGTFEENLTLAARLSGVTSVAVEVTDVGGGVVAGLSRFSQTAAQNLVLFTFINSIASAGLLVSSRRSGVLQRARSSPCGTGTIVTGLAAGWFGIALVQSLTIVVVGSVAFDVDWGDPAAAAALVLGFAAVGCGAGMLVGALGRDEDKVGAVAPIAGIVLGALGGCMVPLEVFPDAMVGIAHAVPHYWAVDAWQRVMFDGDGLGGIVANLAVLGAVAAGALGVAALVLRRSLAGTGRQ